MPPHSDRRHGRSPRVLPGLLRPHGSAARRRLGWRNHTRAARQHDGVDDGSSARAIRCRPPSCPKCSSAERCTTTSRRWAFRFAAAAASSPPTSAPLRRSRSSTRRWRADSSRAEDPIGQHIRIGHSTHWCMDDDRRGHRRRPPPRSRARTAAGDVHQLSPGPADFAVHRHAHGRRSRVAGGIGARGDAAPRQEHPALRHADDVRRCARTRSRRGASSC